MDEERIDPGHKGIRDVLRVVGPIVLGIGVLLTVVAFVSFFAAFGGSGPPKYFWCGFIGLPMMALGGVMTKLGYIGKITRYMSGEISPVAKDTINYVGTESREGIKAVASAIGEGLRGTGAGAAGTKVRCHKCNELLEENAKFCSNCGAAIVKNKECPGCRELNDPDAKFCDNCGYRFI